MTIKQIDARGRAYRGGVATALEREREEAAHWWPKAEERASEELDPATSRRERAYSLLTRAWEYADETIEHWWTCQVRLRLSRQVVTTAYPAPGQTVGTRLREDIPEDRIARIASELAWVEEKGRHDEAIDERDVAHCVARMWGVEETLYHAPGDLARELAAARKTPRSEIQAGPAWDAALRIYERWTTARMETLADPPHWALDRNGRQRWWWYRMVEIEWCWARWGRRAPIYAGAGWKEQIERGANTARRTGRLDNLASAIEWLHWSELNRRAGRMPWTSRFWRRSLLTGRIVPRTAAGHPEVVHADRV